MLTIARSQKGTRWMQAVGAIILASVLPWLLGSGCLTTTEVVEGPQGEQGPPGPQGESGALAVYGDGSAGAVILSPTEGGLAANSQYTDLTIEAGRTQHLVTGTVIRCTGNFVNNGMLSVGNGVGGGYTNDDAISADTLSYPYQPAALGWSIRGASNGELAGNHAAAAGGVGGTGLTAGQAQWLLEPGIVGGGGGGNSSGGSGGFGGGALVILVRGTFTNNGSIQADGDSGSANAGGGAGGVIIIASRTSIVNTGTISARGGNSRDVDLVGSPVMGSGGAGGGGIVHLLAPAVTEGTIDVAGGTPGLVAAAGADAEHLGGGGGGACGGSGGYGGNVPAGNPSAPQQGQEGGPGVIIVDLFDPTNLF